MWSAFRVPAPGLELSEELRWVLLRAFAPASVTAPGTVDATKVVRLSRALDLAARIATRHSATLPHDLGPDATRQMTFDRLQVVASDRVLSALSDEISHVARLLGCPVIWMKHAALRRSGVVPEGERAARDVDLLVPAASAQRLQRALLERGFRRAKPTPQFHLPPLQRAPGEVVEIHTALWGIQLPGRATSPEGASAESLISDGSVERIADGSYLPKSPLLAAHAIVHGLVQHRTSPEGYPIMRVLSDLCSLAPVGGGGGQRYQAFAAHPVASALTHAAAELSEALSRGADVFSFAKESPELELLRHVVAAGTDPAYRRALRFERVLDLASPGALQRAFLGAFSSSELVARGEGSGPALHRLNARAERPVSLALELARGAASFGDLHLRRRSRH